MLLCQTCIVISITLQSDSQSLTCSFIRTYVSILGAELNHGRKFALLFCRDHTRRLFLGRADRPGAGRASTAADAQSHGSIHKDRPGTRRARWQRRATQSVIITLKPGHRAQIRQRLQDARRPGRVRARSIEALVTELHSADVSRARGTRRGGVALARPDVYADGAKPTRLQEAGRHIKQDKTTTTRPIEAIVIADQTCARRSGCHGRERLDARPVRPVSASPSSIPGSRPAPTSPAASPASTISSRTAGARRSALRRLRSRHAHRRADRQQRHAVKLRVPGVAPAVRLVG